MRRAYAHCGFRQSACFRFPALLWRKEETGVPAFAAAAS